MTKEERLQEILDLINEKGKLQVNELTDRFDVADMTIRRDLNELEKLGKLRRTHGGAVSYKYSLPTGTSMLLGDINPETSYNIRKGENLREKNEIALSASLLLSPGEIVFLDSGSTALAIAKAVPIDISCKYVTNGVNVAMELLGRGCPRVVTIGGEVDINTWSSRGSMAAGQIRRLHFDKAFLSCNAVSSLGDVMIGNDAETVIKQSVMQSSNKTYLAADSSKFSGYSLVSYASANEFEAIITDSGLSADQIIDIEKCGGKIWHS